jgi:predicted SAM-dependent methyltransferase
LARLKRRLVDARNVRRLLARAAVKRIVVGSEGICALGWIPTDMDFLNLCSTTDWERLVQPGSLDAILAEHVWEHLDPADAEQAALNCFRFLRPGGHLRAAVPDGLHPDPGYIESVRVDGCGPGADDHKVLYRHDSFAAVFTAAGFDVRLYEYFDESGRFQFHDWDPRDGMVWRSLRYDQRNRDGNPNYSSIVLDGTKPAQQSRRS